MTMETNLPVKAKIIAPQYILGEEKLRYDTNPEWLVRAEQFSMVLDASLWGWGDVYKTHNSTVDMAVKTLKKTLIKTTINSKKIDTLIICSTYFGKGP